MRNFSAGPGTASTCVRRMDAPSRYEVDVNGHHGYRCGDRLVHMSVLRLRRGPAHCDQHDSRRRHRPLSGLSSIVPPHPRALSRVIITANPPRKPSVATSIVPERTVSGINSSIPMASAIAEPNRGRRRPRRPPCLRESCEGSWRTSAAPNGATPPPGPPRSLHPETPRADGATADRPRREKPRQQADRTRRRRSPPRSMAGTSRDQHDAATMTPAANPIIASISCRGTERKNRTGRVPSAVRRYVPMVASSA